MKTFVLSAAVAALFLAAGFPAQANEIFEMYADSTMDGHAGVLMRTTDNGVIDATLFLFEEAGMIRAYAEREFGSPTWDIFSDAQYITPATSISIDDTWRFLDEQGSETVATAVAMESITTPAGTFSCYRADVEIVSDPGTVVSSMWVSSGIGLVRQMDFFQSSSPAQFDLQSSNLVGGSGFFPLAAGNIWEFTEIILPVESSSWGAIKAKYNN